MKSFLYPTEATATKRWIDEMLASWEQSGCRYLCFPFASFVPRQLISLVAEDESFWLYMYYRQGKKDSGFLFGGQVHFRFLIQAWSLTRPHNRETYYKDFSHLQETIWFTTSSIEKICKPSGVFLTRDDFLHIEGKNLASAMRSTIPPVALQTSVEIIERYTS